MRRRIAEPRSVPHARKEPARLARMSVEVRDVAPGLWLWRQPHWGREGDDWEPEVSSFVVESRGEVARWQPRRGTEIGVG